MRRVLIIGDSQSQGIGVPLQNALKAQGDSVTRISRPGYDTKGILKVAKQKVTDPSKYDLVFVFAGGARTWSPNKADPLKVNVSSVKGLLEYLSPAGDIVWVGPPPATEISNLSLAKKIFGSKVRKSDYWFSTGTARRRDEKNAIFKARIFPHATYYDVRDKLVPFPPQGDGIHVKGSAAKLIAKDLTRYPLPASADAFPIWAVVGVGAVMAFLVWKKQKA